MKKICYQPAVQILQQGGIVAYPTEAVYGLGCDPFNESAVKKLLALKQRDVRRGLILLIPNHEALSTYIENLSDPILNKLYAAWPGPVTFLLPARPSIPSWITGQFKSVAMRMTAHPIANQLTQEWGAPLVSTSANIANQIPAKTAAEVKAIFGDAIDYIIEGKVGDAQNPSKIIDALTDQVIRK